MSQTFQTFDQLTSHLRAQLKEGRIVEPTQPELQWTAPAKEGQPAAYVGLDAFSVPMQGIGAGKAEHRMLYTALLYTPAKEHSRYLVDFELDALAEQVRSQARALGITQVSDRIAVTDGGNGLEEALQRHLADNGKKVFCFISQRTKRPLRADSLSDRVVRLAKKAGVRPTMHTMRKGFGCRYAGKVPAQVLQKLMRHRRIKTTIDYYANVDDAVMEAVLGAKPNKLYNTGREEAKPPPDGQSANASQDETYKRS